jgi:hypothetical protein
MALGGWMKVSAYSVQERLICTGLSTGRRPSIAVQNGGSRAASKLRSVLRWPSAWPECGRADACQVEVVYRAAPAT